MKTVTLIPGDGIGLEIAASLEAVFSAAKARVTFETKHAGLTSFENTGKLMPEQTLQSIEKNQIAIKGPTTTPVGTGHRSINVFLRQHFDLYANVRPIYSIPGVDCLRNDINLIIVRENTEDLYAGIEYMVGDGVAHGIKLITERGSRRIGRFAFDLAKNLDRKKVTVVHKANIMKLTDGLFLRSVQSEGESHSSNIECNDLIVDNCCMQLVTKPQNFDVIVTENLYGDILSDLASGLVGGLGVAAGANIGEKIAIFEPVHGSAPDIAGKNLANPTAMLLSGVMMLRHLGDNSAADIIERSVKLALSNKNTRTKDLGGPLGTKEFTEAVLSNIGK
jgi:isocitrate dehydrogenase (NAD+)